MNTNSSSSRTSRRRWPPSSTSATFQTEQLAQLGMQQIAYVKPVVVNGSRVLRDPCRRRHADGDRRWPRGGDGGDRPARDGAGAGALTCPCVRRHALRRRFDLREDRRRYHRARIDPADISVAAAIDHVQLAARAVAEHQHRLIGEVHPHHRLAHREQTDLGGLLGDHRRVGLPVRRHAAPPRRPGSAYTAAPLPAARDWRCRAHARSRAGDSAAAAWRCARPRRRTRCWRPPPRPRRAASGRDRHAR